MDFLLRVKQLSDVYIISNPSTYDLEVAVYFLTFNPINYLTLECTPSFWGIKTIKADDYYEGCVFVKVFVEDSVNPDATQVYGQTMINDDFLAMLKDFRDGITPDIKGWEMIGSN